ncbi:Hypothetical protein, secreted [Salinibacter ruber M8]|uniref:Uncharacterized protein n=1 Tax=Salinibacter ruber (strain M8) TaxID=761659 RepID=D5H5B6_SALRM|nr:Hypothetical protein, secreted [Salinibacter ruber M8]
MNRLPESAAPTLLFGPGIPLMTLFADGDTAGARLATHTPALRPPSPDVSRPLMSWLVSAYFDSAFVDKEARVHFP